jgi:hypothetical protein
MPDTPRSVNDVLGDRMFLAMALLDPRRAMLSYGIRADEDSITALERAADGEADHWLAVVREATAARGDICNICRS